MEPWLVLTLILTWGRSVSAELVSDFTNHCDEFLYKKKEPSGIPLQHRVRLCQRLEGFPLACFATLYDTSNRIPIWSAYRLTGTSTGSHQSIPKSWYIEPQVINQNIPRVTMQEENAVPEPFRTVLNQRQAINADYEGSYFDRGHLFPNSFQRTQIRESTFTLTNAVPMDPCFNRVTWARLEQQLKSQLLSNCLDVKGDIYLVTGAVPDRNRKIPVLDPDQTAPPAGPSQHYNRVSVPSHVWTAACCAHRDGGKTFSLAFLGENKAEGAIETLQVQELEARLMTLYAAPGNVAVFSDPCQGPDKGQRDKIAAEIENKLATGDFRIDQATKRVAEILAEKSAEKKARPSTDTTVSLRMASYSVWAKVYNSEPGHFCELSPPGSVGHDQPPRSPERGGASGTEGPVCLVRKRATLPTPALGGPCVSDVCSSKKERASWCRTAQGRDYCCTDRCDFNEKAKRHECQSASHGKVPCSPQYSRVTAAGAACRSDHPCGRHGAATYWCYIDYAGSRQDCCSPRYPCGSRGPQLCASDDAGAVGVKCHL